MRIISTVAAIIVAGQAVVADPLRFYEPVARFGDWAVACEGLDDMGGITWTDCAVVAVDGVDEAIAIVVTKTPPRLALPERTDIVAVSFGALTVATSNCPDDLCPVPLDATAPSHWGPITLRSDDGAPVPLPTDGLSDAVAEALRLVQ